MADKGLEEPARYRIDDLTLDTGRRLVMRGDTTLEVSGLTFDLLRAIVEAAPNIVSSDELVTEVWSGRATSPETITQRAMMLRQALEDSAENPRYFEVVRGQGLRLVADVERPVARKTTRSNRNYFAIGGAIAVLALIAYLFPKPVDPVPPARLPHSVAVLPFVNLSPDPDNAYFAAGIHQSTLNQLAKIHDLTVIARTSVLQYQIDPPPIPEIAAALNVETVLEGSVRYNDNNVLITAQLVDGATGKYLWSGEYPGDLTEVFLVQSQIASAIATALQAELRDVEIARIEKPLTHSADAYALYLRALAQNSDASVSLLEQAIEIDPEFATAHAQRARLMSLTLRFLGPQADGPSNWEGWENGAIASAERALQLDENSALAYAALGMIHEFNWRRKEAEASFTRALQASPNDSTILSDFAAFKRAIGEYDAAIRLGQRAVVVDPRNAFSRHQLGVSYIFARDYERALATFEDSINLNPSLMPSRFEAGAVRAYLGEKDAAVKDLRIAEQMMDETWSSNYFLRARIAYAYSRIDMRETAQSLVAEILAESDTKHIGAGNLAIAYLAIGDTDNMYRVLSDAAAGSIPMDWAATNEIRQNIWSDRVLDEPRFKELRGRIGVWQ